MAFVNLGNGIEILLSAGKATGGGRSWIDFMEANDPINSTIKAGTAITFSVAGTQLPYDGTNFHGVNILGTTELGKTQCDTVPNPEVCPMGEVMVVCKIGTSAKAGFPVAVEADGTFSTAGSYADAKAHFTGLRGRDTIDGNPCFQIRFNTLRGA